MIWSLGFSCVTDLGYGWWIEYAPREFIERGEGTGDLAGGAGPYIVLKTTGQLWRPRMFSQKEKNWFSPQWQWLLDFEQNAFGVLRVSGIVHPTMKYTGNPDLSFLPAFAEFKIEAMLQSGRDTL